MSPPRDFSISLIQRFFPENSTKEATCYATFPHGNTSDSTGQFAALHRGLTPSPEHGAVVSSPTFRVHRLE